MKDIFKTNPLDSFPSITFYVCDLCGMKNPKSHLADDFNSVVILCQPCVDSLTKDSK